MRKIVLSTFLLFSVFCCFGQTSNKRVCRLGFTYDISQNSNWGKNNLVVTSVSPYSNAEKAGIQPYDIITHIESIPVSDVSNDEIAQLLNPANKRNIMLTIKSTSSPSREVILNKECKQINEISENQLAMAFNMYSLETTSGYRKGIGQERFYQRRTKPGSAYSDLLLFRQESELCRS